MPQHKIALVGYGFVNSWFFKMLVKAIFSQDIDAEVVIIDDDHFEDRNAGNQDVSLMDAILGKDKVAVAKTVAETYRIKATTHKTRLDMSNMIDLLEGCTMVIDGVDNVPTRQLLNMCAAALNVPVMHIGISKKGQGRIDWSTPDFSTFPYTHEAMAGRNLTDDDGGGEPPCEMFAHLGNGLMLVNAATKAICLYYGKDPWRSTYYLVDEAIKSLGLGDVAEELIKETVEEMGPVMDSPGILTCWDTHPNGIKVRVNQDTLVEGFYPSVEGI